MFGLVDRQPQGKVECVLMWRGSGGGGCHPCFGARLLATPICYAKAPKAHKNVLGFASLLQHSTQTPCFGGCLFITPICYTQAPQHKDELNNSKSSRIGDPK